MKVKKIILTISTLIVFVLTNLAFLMIKNTRVAVIVELLGIILVILVIGLSYSNFSNNKRKLYLDDEIFNLVLKIKYLIKYLDQKNKPLAVFSVDKLISHVNMHIMKINECKTGNDKVNIALENHIETMNELIELLFDIYHELIRENAIQNYNEYLLNHINNNDDIYENNILFLEDYIDLILVNMYPHLTLMNYNQFLKYAKKLQDLEF